MNIFISGISGTGMGPLALMAKQAGFNVFGTDLAEGAISSELFNAGIPFKVGADAQNGEFLQECIRDKGVDWFVYTSALPKNHPELVLAKKMGLRISKRDELIAFLVDKLGLKMVAVAGTHGKTTTTAMIIWACRELGVPVSYLVGTTLPFAKAGQYKPESEFLIYEADEYDRNFLYFNPWLAVITTISYDHPDTYKTDVDYRRAFRRFMGQSERVIKGDTVSEGDVIASGKNSAISERDFTLSGEVRRKDAKLAFLAVREIFEEIGRDFDREKVIQVLNAFPGVGRRFERLATGFYSDYAHHPEEVAETVKMALEEASRHNFKGVVVVYEPHQNTRQHQILDGYKDVFSGIKKLFWLPTFLTREDESLKVLTPEDFIEKLELNKSAAKEVAGAGVAKDFDENFADAVGVNFAEAAEADEELADRLKQLREQGYLILLMTAGPADKWLRNIAKETI